MPEFRFKNPALEAISNSFLRMNQKMDLLIFKLFVFLTKNRRLNMHDRTIENEEPSYENPISLKPFGELETPVLDSEGFLREKGEKKINLGIYSRKPVTITESTDLQKVQKDYKSLENRMDALINRMDNLMSGWEEEKKKWEETTKKWEKEKEDTAKRWEMQRDEMTKKWENERNEMKKKWDEERKKIRQENHALINNLRAENSLLEKENDELKEEIEEKNEIIKKLINNSESDNGEIKVLKNPQQSGWKKTNSLPPDAKWVERNTFLGIKHTFSDLRHTKEGKEYSFRIHAHYGDIKKVEKYLNENKNAVNTRMWPDAMTSFLLACEDKTPLMVASRAGHLEIVNLLLKNGANVNYLDRHRLTALDYAEINKHHQIAIILKENGAENGRYLKDIFENSNNNLLSAPKVSGCR